MRFKLMAAFGRKYVTAESVVAGWESGEEFECADPNAIDEKYQLGWSGYVKRSQSRPDVEYMYEGWPVGEVKLRPIVHEVSEIDRLTDLADKHGLACKNDVERREWLAARRAEGFVDNKRLAEYLGVELTDIVKLDMGKRTDAETVHLIRMYRRDKMSVAQIAVKIDMSQDYVYKILNS